MKAVNLIKLLSALLLFALPPLARADSLGTNSFTVSLSNSYFPNESASKFASYFEGNMKGASPGLRIALAYIDSYKGGGAEPCLNGCLPGQTVAFDFVANSERIVDILIGDVGCSTGQEDDTVTCLSRASFHIRGESATTLPAATLAPATTVPPEDNTPTLILSAPFSMDVTAKIFSPAGELRASRSVRVNGTAQLRMFTLEPTFSDRYFGACEGFGERCWVLDRATFTGTAAAVPEPASLLLLGTGLIGAVAGVRGKRKAK